MIAQIIPLRKFPSSLDFFSYFVPPEFETQVQVGQLVQIPFRNSNTFGIIFSFEKNDENFDPKKIKPLLDICFAEPCFSQAFLRYLEHIGKMYGVSLPSIFEIAFPTITPRTLRQLHFLPIEQNTRSANLAIYKKYSHEEEHLKTIIDSIDGQTVIFVPEKQYLEKLFLQLPKDLQKQTVCWHGELKTTEKRKIWTAIRNKEKNIILTTRSGVFLPLIHVDTIIVDYEHHKEHKNADQAPRFALKDITELLRIYTGAKEIHMSSSPSVESYYALHKNGYDELSTKPENLFESNTTKNITLVNMKDERKGGNYSPLCEQLENLLVHENENIFLCINRKGLSTVLLCSNCHFEEKCPQCDLPFVFHGETKILFCHYCKIKKNVPNTCPKCLQPNWDFKGIGTETIEKRVKELVIKQSKNIFRIEGEDATHVELNTNLPSIIIGTEKAIESVQFSKTKIIALLDFDRQVALPEFKASESAWSLIQEIQYLRSDSSLFFIQTFDPKQLLLKSLSQPDRFYRSNLNARQAVGYPPYKYVVRYYFGGLTQPAAFSEVQRVFSALQTYLTQTQKNATLSDQIEMQPKYFRGKFWYGIIVKLDKETWKTDLCDLNAHFPRGWKIDPNPQTLLHP